VARNDPRHGIWILPLIIVAMVGSTIIFVNALTPVTAPGNGGTATITSTTGGNGDGTSTTSTTEPATTTTLADEVNAYLDEVDALELSAELLLERAVEINQMWDDDTASFSETEIAFEELIADVDDFVARVETANPTNIPILEPAHLDITIAARAMAEAAGAMLDGFQGPTAEPRREALTEYEAAAQGVADAIAVVREQVAGGLTGGSGTTLPSETTLPTDTTEETPPEE